MRMKLLVVAALAAASPAAAQGNVKKGVAAWNNGDWPRAVKEWKAPAEAGDPDAQFNMGQAYKLGRGVDYDADKARAWYLKAARQGHQQAQDNYGLSLYQDGRKGEAVEWLEKSSVRDEKRAQLVLGTLLYNGDSVARDWPRAYALISRSAAQGMEQAVAARAKMDRYLTAEDRRIGSELAGLSLAQWAIAMSSRRSAGGTASSVAASSPKPAAARIPPQGADAADHPVEIARNSMGNGGPLRPGTAARYAQPYAVPTAPTLVARNRVSSGGWKIQLGAFRDRGTAAGLWSRIGPAFEGGRPVYDQHAGLTRLQVAGFDTQNQASGACSQLKIRGLPCFVVRP